MEIKWRLSAGSGREILDKLIEALILGVVFLVPLWLAYLFPTYHIFELNKIVLFRILVSLLMLASALKFLLYPPRFNISPYDFFKRYWLIPSLFICALIIISLAAKDPQLAFYGLVERQQGLASYLFYFLWFILLSANLLSSRNGEQQLGRLLKAAAAAATLAALYGILQIFNIDFLSWPEPPHLTGRAFSTFGQPNFLASWLLLVLPLSVYLSFKSRSFYARFGWLVAFLLQLIALVLTGSRAGLFGLVLMVLMVLIYYFKKIVVSRRAKIAVVLSGLAVVALIFVAFDNFSSGRMRELKQLNYGSLGARVNLYQAAFQAWPDHFWLGHGLENTENVFIRYYANDWGVYGNVGQSADRAHNLILDVLLAGGVLGLVAWILLVFFFFRLGSGPLAATGYADLRRALMLGAGAYLFSLLFGFSVVTTEIYFWFFLALLIFMDFSASSGSRLAPTIPATFRPRFSLASVFKIIFILFVFLFSARQIQAELETLKADYYFRSIYLNLAQQEYFNFLVLDEYLAAQSPQPILQESYNLFLSNILSEFYPTISELASRRAIGYKLMEIERSLPNRTYSHLLAKAKLNRALEDFATAEDYLESLARLNPDWPSLHYERALLAAAKNDWPETISHYEKALTSLPDLFDKRLNSEHYQDVALRHYLAYRGLGQAYFNLSAWEKSGEYFKLAYQSRPFDFTLLKKIADTYYLRGDLAGAIKYNLHGLARSPEDYNWALALSVLYYESGDGEAADYYLALAQELSPDNEELGRLKERYQAEH